MAFIPVENCAMVEIRCSLFTQQVENSLYFQHDGAILAADRAALAEAVENWYCDSILPYIVNDVGYREVYLTDLTSAVSPTFTQNARAGELGVVAEDPPPNNVSFTIKFNTEFRGRSSRGRNYIFGIPQSVIGINEVSSAWAEDIVDAYELLMSPAFSSGFTWVVCSRYTNNAPRVEGLTLPITAVGYTDLILDSQRNRLPGRGE